MSIPVASRLAAVAILLAAIAAAAVTPVVLAAASETPVRIPDQAVYDLAGVFDQNAEQSAENLAATIRSIAAADVVVVSETVGVGFSAADALFRTQALRQAMGVGRELDGGGLLLYFGIAATGCGGQVQLDGSDGFAGGALPADAARKLVTNDIDPLVASCDLNSALLVGLSRVGTAVLTADAGAGTAGGKGVPAVAAGPPFPEPVTGVAVYDHAGILRPDTIASAEKSIDAIEARTGAEVAVYTQVVEDGRTTEEADRAKLPKEAEKADRTSSHRTRSRRVPG